MPVKYKHIIEKQYIEVEVNGKVDAFSLKDELADICKNKLLPEMEKLFDSKFPGDKIIRIDRLDIDAGNVSTENWENGFVENVIKNLSKYIDETGTDSFVKDESDYRKFVNKEKADAENILFFLERGFLTWYSHIDNRNELQLILEELLSNNDEGFKKDLKELLRKNRDALKRLVFQFDRDKLELIQKKLFPDINPDTQLDAGSAMSEASFINNIPEEIFRSLKTDVISKLPEILEPDYKNDLDKIIYDQEVKHRSTEETITDEKYEWYISNSGLVILHPFLLKLFENTGYVENKEWIGNEQQQRAITLLQYAVTGAEEYPEFLLLLNKIICGYEILESLPAEILLSEFEKNEADELLKSVIGHWTALKNTSVPGLRETFLMRNGKLSRDDRGWLMHVELKTVDILINKLPWGMSMIKLPWMKEMLRVEWIY